MCKLSPVLRQFLAIGCCNLLSFTFGLSSGWATINFIELQKENTTFPTGTFTLEEATFVATSMSIGGVVGNFLILPIAHRFGYTRALCLMGIPFIISNVLIIVAQSKYYVYISRIIAGFSGGASIIIMPSMVADIAFDHVRGSLNSIFDPAMNTGVAVSFLLSGYFNPVDQAKIHIIVPAIFVVLALFLPQTPDFWIKRNKKNHAEKSQKFYRGKDSIAHVEALLPKANATQEKQIGKEETHTITISDFGTREAIKSMRIAFISLVLSFLSGNITISSFVTAIFAETGSTLSEANSSILIVAVQIFANLLVLNIVDRIDRRILLITSSIATAVLFVLFGIYCKFYVRTPGLEWVPPLCLSAITFSGCMGVLPIPYIVAIEIFPAKIRSACLAITIAMMWTCLFVLGSLFPIVNELYGMYTSAFIFAGFCITLATYAYFFIPETRGKSTEEIKQLLSK